MKKLNLLIASDSFKGTLCNKDINEIWENVISNNNSNIFNLSYCYIADGGEGTLEAFSHLVKGRKHYVKTFNPLNEPINSEYFVNDENEAIIEFAQASGLTLIENRLDPLKASSYGTGYLIKKCIKNGIKKFKIFFGGSATNDGGCGILAALGCKFYNKNNKEFIPTGGSLLEIYKIDFDGFFTFTKGVDFVCYSDVENPLCGENGASFIFGPQKGASSNDVKLLDFGLLHLSNLIESELNIKIKDIKGIGSAGGAAIPFVILNSPIKSGIDEILKLNNFEEKAKGCDYIVSGEGCFDEQSYGGKVFSGIVRKINNDFSKLIILCGKCNVSETRFPIFTTSLNHQNFEEIKNNAVSNYKQTVLKVLKFLENKNRQ